MKWKLTHARLDSIEFTGSYNGRDFKLKSRPLSGGHELLEVIGDRLSFLIHKSSPSVLLSEDEYHKAFDSVCKHARNLCVEN